MPFQNGDKPLIPEQAANRILQVFGGVILCGILVAGLSPFTPRPKNQVRWLDHQNGLYFGDYATILSSAPLNLDGPPDGPCSVELWLQPGVIDDSNTMLAFQTPETPLQFTIHQNSDALVLARQVVGADHQASEKHIYIAGAFRQDTPVLVTVTSGAQGTAIYLNGVLTRSSADFGLTRHDLNGGIVVGNSPVANDSWSGVLRGIGLYNKELAAEEVRQNYAAWTAFGLPRALEEKEAKAVFGFTERTGTVVHNQVPGGIDLYIPDHYLVLHPAFLEAFWRGTNWGWGFWKDVLINVGGFVPLGFFFCVYFSQSMPVTRATLLTIIFGCAVSFLIEVGQYYLPTRDSGSRDLITNTLGTVLGALMYWPGFGRRILARFGIVSLEHSHPYSVPGDAVLKARMHSANRPERRV